MEDTQIDLPTESDLHWWIKYLTSTENSIFGLSDYLPAISDDWYQGVMNVVGVLNLPHYNKLNLYEMGACLFYKVNKAHNQIDSNKRSSIIVTFLFFLINSRLLYPPKKVKDWAKMIARSKGRAREDWWESRLAEFFKQNTSTIKD